MKKYLIPAIALTAIAMVSCSNDDQPGTIHEGPAVFTIRIPGAIGSRATLGDQTVADVDNLQWSVYEVDGTNKTFVYSDQKDNAFPGAALEETVSIQLAKGKKYQVVFYADNAENTFASFADGTVTVDYDNAASNTVAEDAFTGMSVEFDGNAGIQQTVTLTRPFAQLNWGTDDLNAKSIAQYVGSLTAQVQVSGGIYTTFNALTGELGGEITAPVSFDAITVKDIDTDATFPVSGYDLLAMNYLLTGNGTIECTLTFNNGFDPVTVNSVPVQINHRTNIYGSLLTMPTEFKIIVDPAFQTPDNNVEVAVVRSADAFVAAIEKGQDIEVPADASIDLSALPEIELANNQTINVEGSINTARAQIGISGAGNIAYIRGNGTITSTGETGNRPLNVYDGATLDVEGVSIETTQNNGGSSIFSDNGNLVLNNMKVAKSSNFAIAANGGTLKATNCEFNSDSNNQEGTYTYTLNIASGCVAVLDNCTVNGIQGGITVDNGTCTINSGTYTTGDLPGYPGTAFYPVYVCNNGILTVNGGEFINNGSAKRATIYDGDNDINKPFAKQIDLMGGKYNTPTYSQRTKEEIPAAEGYKWEPISDGVFTLQIVPAN